MLTNENIANMFFINDETIIDQKGFYSTALDMDGDMLSMLVNMLPSEIGKVINGETDVRLQYRLNGGTIDSFEIVAGFESLKKRTRISTTYIREFRFQSKVLNLQPQEETKSKERCRRPSPIIAKKPCLKR